MPDPSPYIIIVYMCARVFHRRFGESFVIRKFVIFQFLCVPRGMAKSRQTVRARRRSCPSHPYIVPNVCYAYVSMILQLVLIWSYPRCWREEG